MQCNKTHYVMGNYNFKLYNCIDVHSYIQSCHLRRHDLGCWCFQHPPCWYTCNVSDCLFMRLHSVSAVPVLQVIDDDLAWFCAFAGLLFLCTRNTVWWLVEKCVCLCVFGGRSMLDDLRYGCIRWFFVCKFPFHRIQYFELGIELCVAPNSSLIEFVCAFVDITARRFSIQEHG